MASAPAVSRPTPPAALERWLDKIGRRLRVRTRSIAHGGTALTLLGVKESTKDVDLSFEKRTDYERFREALSALGYRVLLESAPIPWKMLTRMELAGAEVTPVDLHFPAWNDWKITRSIRSRATIRDYGGLELLIPDPDVVFLFKTYPLRVGDLQDLVSLVERRRVDPSRIWKLFLDQDHYRRGELLDENLQYEPLNIILEMRTRMAGSLSLLPAKVRRPISGLTHDSIDAFRALRLSTPLRTLIVMLRTGDQRVDWDDVLGKRFETLRVRLANQ